MMIRSSTAPMVTNPNDDNTSRRSNDVVMLIGCVIAITVLLVIIVMLFYWHRSRLMTFLKTKNRAFVVEILGGIGSRQNRRNAITSETFGNTFVEEYHYRTRRIKSQIYNIELDETNEEIKSLSYDKNHLDVDKYTSYSTLKASLGDQNSGQYSPLTIILHPPQQSPNINHPFPINSTHAHKETSVGDKDKVKDHQNESVHFYKHPNNNVRKVEVVRTYSSGHKYNMSTKEKEIEFSYTNIAMNSEYAVPNVTPKHVHQQYETPVIKIEHASPEHQHDNKKLDNLLTDLDIIYSRVKEQRINDHYTEVLSDPNS